MRTITQVIAAGREQRVEVQGTFIRIVSITGLDVTMMKVNDEPLEIRAGDRNRFPKLFTHFYIDNSQGGVQITVKITVGEGDQDSAAVTGTVNVSNLSGTTFSSEADVVLGAGTFFDLPVDTNNREQMVQALIGNTGEICVQDIAAAGAEGFRLQATGHIIVSTTAPVRVRNATAADQSFSRTYVKA